MYMCAADQVYGDQEMHSTVRNLCMDYMVSGMCVWVVVYSGVDLLFSH